MYKLFLTFRYLTRKKIVLFPILVVWLCVMMLIIVTSIMGGFVERVRSANRDLFGDIIVSSGSSSRGFAHYEELSAELKKEFPQVAVATPTVQAYGLIFVRSAQQTRPMLLVGIDPVERAKVSKFRESLFLQYKSPMASIDELTPRLPATRDELMKFADARIRTLEDEEKASSDALWKMRVRDLQGEGIRENPNFLWLWGLIPAVLIVALLVWRARRKESGWGYFTASVTGLVLLLVVAASVFWPLLFPRSYALAEDRHDRTVQALKNALRTFNHAASLKDGRYATREELVNALVPPVPTFGVPEEASMVREGNKEMEGPLAPTGCIVGSQIGFFARDTRGNFDHPVTPEYRAVTITVFPANQRTGAVSVDKESAQSQNFTIIDDSHTGVYDVDSFNVYAPLEVVQKLAGMRVSKEDIEAGAENRPPLCHELLIKLDKTYSASEMRHTRYRINEFVQKFFDRFDPMERPRLLVQTWDEKQAKYLGAVQNEKVMMTFILGLMSMVVLVVIFLIFYQIVRDKTRDIGIIKAVGGSEEGVAGIFLTYGLFIGLVGGGLGVLTGTLFVTHTNEIHEWIYQTTGIIIWDRSVYLFDRIPDIVNPWDCVVYFAVALAAGVIGALIPAIVAGSQDPVQAVRYE
jgi:ABC-type lipoprotein release transport system permease subunit